MKKPGTKVAGPPPPDVLRALLAAAKASAWTEGAPPFPGDRSAWGETFLETARAQHALSIIGPAVRSAPRCSPGLREELERIDRGCWATHMVTRAALGPVLAEAAADGIPVVVYKGAALAVRLYDAPWTRAMTDVDALIGEADAPRFHALLARHAFTPIATASGRSWSVRASHERTFIPPTAGARIIDVHTAPAQPARYHFSVADMLGRAQPGTLFDAPVRFLTAADELLVMAANQAHDHYRFGLLRYLDAWLLTTRGAVDWEALIASAHAAGVATAAWLTLTNARRIAGAAVPQSVLARLRPSAPRAAWLRATLDCEGSGEPRLALPRRLEQLFLLYPTLDRPSDFLRFAAVHGTLRALDAAAAALRRLGRR